MSNRQVSDRSQWLDGLVIEATLFPLTVSFFFLVSASLISKFHCHFVSVIRFRSSASFCWFASSFEFVPFFLASLDVSHSSILVAAIR